MKDKPKINKRARPLDYEFQKVSYNNTAYYRILKRRTDVNMIQEKNNKDVKKIAYMNKITKKKPNNAIAKSKLVCSLSLGPRKYWITSFLVN